MKKVVVILIILIGCIGAEAKTQTAGGLRSLYNGGAYQSYFEESLKSLAYKSFNKADQDAVIKELEKRCEDLLINKGVFFTTTMASHIGRIKNLNKCRNLGEAWRKVVFKGYASDSLIKQLPSNNLIKDALIIKRLLSVLRAKGLRGALGYLSQYSDQQHQKARLFYQLKKYKQSASEYETMAKSRYNYVITREELAWAYLMSHNDGALVGLLNHLNNNELTPLAWRLEGPVLSSFLYLKTCNYNQVKEEIKKYQNDLRSVADLMEGKVPVRPHPLLFIAQKMRAQLEHELRMAPQNFPKTSEKNLNTLRYRLKNKLNIATSIYNREKNVADHNFLKLSEEATLKMRFVKAELMNRLLYLQKENDGYNIINSPHLSEKQIVDKKQLLAKTQGRQSYGAGGDVWSDELFQLKGVLSSACNKVQEL